MLKETNFETKEKEPVSAELIEQADEETLQAIEKISKEAFELESLQYERDWLVRFLDNPEGINIMLKNQKNESVGFILSMPARDFLEEIKDFDPDFAAEGNNLYLDLIAVRPKDRDKGFMEKGLDLFFKEARKKDFDKIIAYGEVKKKIDLFLQEHYGGEPVRKFKDWEGEDYTYMEWDLEKEKQNNENKN